MRSIASSFLLQDQSYFSEIQLLKNHNIYLIGSMGTGKTETILNILSTETKEFPDLRILILNARRAPSAKFQTEYEHLAFMTYWDLNKSIVYPPVIIQVESLHRINTAEITYDIIIIDEAFTISEQMYCEENSSLTKLKFLSLQKMVFLLERAQRVFIFDAYTTIDLIKVFQNLKNA